MRTVSLCVCFFPTPPWSSQRKYIKVLDWEQQPLQVSRFITDREAWHAALHRVAKSWTQLSDWTTSFTKYFLCGEGFITSFHHCQLLNTLWRRCHCHQHFIDEEIKLSKQRGWGTWLMKAGVWICEQVCLTARCTLLPHPHPPQMLLLVQAWLISVCTWTLSLPCRIRPLTTEQSLCIHSWTWQFVLHADNRVIPLKGKSVQVPPQLRPSKHSLLLNALALVSYSALPLSLLVPGQSLQGFLFIPRTQPASSHPEAFASIVLSFRRAVPHLPQEANALSFFTSQLSMTSPGKLFLTICHFTPV